MKNPISSHKNDFVRNLYTQLAVDSADSFDHYLLRKNISMATKPMQWAVIQYNPHLECDEQVHIVSCSSRSVRISVFKCERKNGPGVEIGETKACVCIAAEYCQSILPSDDKQ